MIQDDVEKVHASGVEVVEFQASEREADETPFWPKEKIRDWLKTENDVLLIAEKDEEIIGYFMSLFHIPTGLAYIENVFVEENYRKEGVGDKLFEKGIKRLKDNGARYVAVLSKPDNYQMHSLLDDRAFNRGNQFVWRDKILE